MATSRLYSHHSLPAPVVHAGFSVSQSKSHVLAGVQDAYWSDDEAEDAECPLCLEEMDISDLNFKPCICGYQICRFCWHHIKENLNKRCPACRRVYTDDAVEFKPIAADDHKRLTQQKKQRERERKELDSLGRRHLANVRVVQRNVVYVIGIGPRFAKEELIPTLRSSEYFGQYGKITKILLVKRTPSGGGAPVVGLYITYHRREDAARCIAAVDGTASPGGGREPMRASYGTTKYCMAFLRGVSCSDHSCMNLHEWGDEKDCFTKEDLTTLKHTMKATETRARNTVTSSKKVDDQDGGLPRAAAWGQKTTNHQTVPTQNPPSNHNAPVTGRQVRRGGVLRQSRNSSSVMPSGDLRAIDARLSVPDRKTASATKTPSQTSSPSSTPTISLIPQRAATQAELKDALQKKESLVPSQPHSPSLSTTAGSDNTSGSQELATSAVRLTDSPQPSLSRITDVPPSVPAAPPGLSAPPGIPSPSHPPRPETASPRTPLLSSQSSYQMSIAARALLDDVKARRESALPAITGQSPFPDFDRTLQTLSDKDSGGFSFNLDPALAGDDINQTLSGFEIEPNAPFHGSYIDALPTLGVPSSSTSAFVSPPGLSYPRHPGRSTIYDPSMVIRSSDIIEKTAADSSSYMGSFNPFADGSEGPSNLVYSPLQRSQYPLDDDMSRKVSRFGFARGRQGSTAASSPLHAPSPLSYNNGDGQSFYNSTDTLSQASQWLGHNHTQPNSAMGSPLVQLDYSQPRIRFHSFDSGVSEAQLRDFIQSSRDRAGMSVDTQNSLVEPQVPPFNLPPGLPPFNDPAIMSARFASPLPEDVYSHVSYGPPPGLSYPQGVPSPSNAGSAGNLVGNSRTGMDSNESAHIPFTPPPVLPLALSSSDFPALTSSLIDHPLMQEVQISDNTDGGKAQEKAERKAAKKAVAAQKAAEKQKIALERAAVKAAERMKVAQEKIAEKERTALLKAQEQSAEKEIASIEKKTVKLERERSLQIQKERATQVGKEKGVQMAKPIMEKRIDTIQESKSPSQPLLTLGPLKASEPEMQVPLLSKKPKKTKSTTKPVKAPKEASLHDEIPTLPSALASDIPQPPTDSSSNNSRSHSLDRSIPTSVEELLEDINILYPGIDIPNHPFFDVHKINPAATMPLEYGPLVHALSALSVGGGSFANNMPSGSIDNAVSSFQQLLETLTQTISDLLRLLPRTTWDDSSSFDGVLRDMLKGDDFLDDGNHEGHGKEDEVVALTLALERRARWMEVQLSKLEELHRDINTAAVRAVLSFNDSGWDRNTFMPRVENTLRRFDSIAITEDGGVTRSMTADELEKKLAVAREAAVFAEAELREVMERFRLIRPLD